MPDFNESSALLLKRAVDAGITSPAELSNLMGNASVETRQFSTMHESFAYRSAAQVIGAVSSADNRFTMKQIQDAVASHDPKQVATVMYENRADLGNTQAGDGWTYHGRGYLQYTGRDNYETYGHKFGVDLKNNPNLAADPETSAKLAIAFWQDKVPQALREDPRAAGKIINGGSNGADERVAASQSWAKTITPELVADIQSGKITLEQLSQTRSTSGVLKPGDQGASVHDLQVSLAKLGYTDAHGQPIKTDSDFGPSTRHAVEAFQRDHHVAVDGKVGPHTQHAMQEAIHAHAQPSLDSAAHPGNPFYREAQKAVYDLDQRIGRTPNQQSDQLAGALAPAAQQAGLQRIDEVRLSEDGLRAFAIESGALQRFAHVQTAEAVNMTLMQSGQAWMHNAARAVQPQPQPEQAMQRTPAPITL